MLDPSISKLPALLPGGPAFFLLETSLIEESHETIRPEACATIFGLHPLTVSAFVSDSLSGSDRRCAGSGGANGPLDSVGVRDPAIRD